MSGVRRKRLDLERWVLQDRDQRWNRERGGAEEKQVIPSMQAGSTLLLPKPAAKKASKPSPCSSGKSVSSKPGSLRNKGSVSCLQAISSETQSMSGELAVTSKIPHRGKPPPAFRCNIHPAQYHNKHRSEHVREGVLNGSMHGAVSKQIQSWDVLRRRNKMKHLFNRTNTEEITDSELPFSAENLDDSLADTTSVKHFSIFDIQSSESEDEESDDDDLLASWKDTFHRREPHLITFPGSVCRSSLTSTSCSNSARSPETFLSHLSKSAVPDVLSSVSSDGCGFSPTLKQTRPPHGTPQPPSADILDCTPSHGCRFSQRKSSHTSPSDLIIFSDSELEEPQECEAALGWASAAKVPQSLKDSNTEIACRAKQSLLDELSHEEEGDQCRICHSGDTTPTNPLLSPCLCSGSLQFIHFECLKKWIETKLQSGSCLTLVQRCELCVGKLTLDPDTFDWNTCYRRHHQQLDDFSDRFRLQEVAGMLSFRSLLPRALSELATSTSLAPRMRIWSVFPYKIRMRLQRRRGRWSPTPETFDPMTHVFTS